jgi:hypothetical protein
MIGARAGQHVTPTPAGCAHYTCACLTACDEGVVIGAANLAGERVALVEFDHPFRRVLLPLSELNEA